MVDKTPNADVLKWQIEQRAMVQNLLLEMYILYENNKELPKAHKPSLTEKEKDEWFPINRMIGAAFSLWRSAFLTQASSSRQSIYEHTAEFVGKVLSQNSISFADDHRMCELTIVYYNANARYRIERLYGKHPEFLRFEEVKAVENMIVNGTVETTTERDHWDMLFKALKRCFEDYRTRYAR